MIVSVVCRTFNLWRHIMVVDYSYLKISLCRLFFEWDIFCFLGNDMCWI